MLKFNIKLYQFSCFLIVKNNFNAITMHEICLKIREFVDYEILMQYVFMTKVNHYYLWGYRVLKLIINIWGIFLPFHENMDIILNSFIRFCSNL